MKKTKEKPCKKLKDDKKDDERAASRTEGPFAIAFMRAGDDYYVKLNDDLTVCGFTSVEDGLLRFTNTYERHHNRSYEGSMSACINWIFFNPSVVPFDSIEDMKKVLLIGDKFEIHQLSNVSGWMTGIKVDRETGAKVFAKAAKPALTRRGL